MNFLDAIFFHLPAIAAVAAALLLAAVAAGWSFANGRKLLLAGLAAALLLHLVVFLNASLAYVVFPYEGKSVVEGVTMYNSMQYLDGRQPYHAPEELPFRSLVYPPGHEMLLAGFLAVLGPSLYAARLFSLLCALGAALVAGLAVWAHTRRPFAAFLGAALVVACYGITGQWMEQVRSDALMQFLIVLGLYLCDRASHRGRFPLGGLIVLLLALYTKQVAVFAPLAVILFLWFQDRRRATIWAVGYAVAALAIFAAMEAWSGGWFAFYILRVPFAAGTDWGNLNHASTFFGSTWTLLLGVSALVVLALRTGTAPEWAEFRPCRTLLLWALALPGAMLFCLLQSVKWGAALNAFIPMVPVLAVLAAVAFDGLICRFGRQGWIGLIVLIAALMQVAGLTYQPTRPTEKDRAAQREITRWVTAAPGDVFVSVFSSQTYLNGKRYFGDDVCIGDLVRAGVWRDGALIEKIRSGGFALLILRPKLEPRAFADAVHARYDAVSTIPMGTALTRWPGMTVYVPKDAHWQPEAIPPRAPNP